MSKGFVLWALQVPFRAKGSYFWRSSCHFEHRVRTLGAPAAISSKGFILWSKGFEDALSWAPSKVHHGHCCATVVPRHIQIQATQHILSKGFVLLAHLRKRVRTSGFPAAILSKGFVLWALKCNFEQRVRIFGGFKAVRGDGRPPLPGFVL